MTFNNFGFVLVLGALLSCLVLGSPVSENEYKKDILFEEPGAVKDVLATQLLGDFFKLAKELNLDPKEFASSVARELDVGPEDVLNDSPNFGYIDIYNAMASALDKMPKELILQKVLQPQKSTNTLDTGKLYDEDVPEHVLNDEEESNWKVIGRIPSVPRDLYNECLKLAGNLGVDAKEINLYLAKQMNMDTKQIPKILEAEDKEVDYVDGDEPSSSFGKSLDEMVIVLDKMVDNLSLANELNLDPEEVKRFLEENELFDAPEDEEEELSPDFILAVWELLKERFSSMEEKYLQKVEVAERFKKIKDN